MVSEFRSVVLHKGIWVPVSNASFKESVSDNGVKVFKLNGLMVPFDKISRNGVLYNTDSIIAKHKQLIGKPLMYNHQVEGDGLPLGVFTDSYIISTPDNEHPIPGWYYSAEVDPTEERVINKLRGKYLNHVSIQLMADSVMERFTEDGVSFSEAIVEDVVEGSLVPTPGFLDTTAVLSEAFNGNGFVTNIAGYSQSNLVDSISNSAVKDGVFTDDQFYEKLVDFFIEAFDYDSTLQAVELLRSKYCD